MQAVAADLAYRVALAVLAAAEQAADIILVKLQRQAKQIQAAAAVVDMVHHPIHQQGLKLVVQVLLSFATSIVFQRPLQLAHRHSHKLADIKFIRLQVPAQ